MRRGFTLIELLVVISIMGFLATIVLTSVQKARNNARDTARVAEIIQIQKAIQLFRGANDRFPNVSGANCPVGWDTGWPNQPNGFIDELGSYFSAVPIDEYASTGGCTDGYRYIRCTAQASGACDQFNTCGEYYILGVRTLFRGFHPNSPGFISDCPTPGGVGGFHWWVGEELN